MVTDAADTSMDVLSARPSRAIDEPGTGSCLARHRRGQGCPPELSAAADSLATSEEGALPVLLERLAETSRAVAAIRSRNAKRDLLADALAEAGPADVAIVVSYLGGSLRQRRTGVGWRSLQDLPPPAEEASLEVLEVDAAFEAMAALSGAGSAAARTAAVAALFGRATKLEQEFLAG